MSQGTFEIDMLVVDDAETSNNPVKRIFDYTKTLNAVSVSEPNVIKTILSTGDNVITIPNNPSNIIYIETDQTIKVKFNGSAETVVEVSPSAAGVSDGCLFKRGEFTALTINVPGITSANLLIFMGA